MSIRVRASAIVRSSSLWRIIRFFKLFGLALRGAGKYRGNVFASFFGVQKYWVCAPSCCSG